MVSTDKDTCSYLFCPVVRKCCMQAMHNDEDVIDVMLSCLYRNYYLIISTVFQLLNFERTSIF